MTRRRRLALAAAALSALVAFCGFVGLGVWQVERRAWKHALIERVEQRVRATPISAPGPAEWPRLSREGDEYRRVSVSGQWLPGADTLVQASTDLGAGWWVLSALQRADGTRVLVNRGFVPVRRAPPAASGPVTVVGLLRITEPAGGFLRRNDPAAERWYARDVAAIASARRLSDVAPYFVDAERSAGPAAEPGAPVAGLTVIAFHDNHLAYALTWFALAAMVAVAPVIVARHEQQARRSVSS